MADFEAKLLLKKRLQEEANINRQKLRSREEILYGTLPEYKNRIGSVESDSIKAPESMPVSGSGFYFRFLLALFLFGCFLYINQQNIMWGDKAATEYIGYCLETSYEGKLIDFVSNFPYTLPGDEK